MDELVRGIPLAPKRGLRDLQLVLVATVRRPAPRKAGSDDSSSGGGSGGSGAAGGGEW